MTTEFRHVADDGEVFMVRLLRGGGFVARPTGKFDFKAARQKRERRDRERRQSIWESPDA